MNKDECCQKFNPKPWDKKNFVWKNKRFIKDKVFTLFYIPINFGSVMVRLNKKIETANVKMSDFLCLSECTSMWNMNVYLAVDKEIPNAENIVMSGKFVSKVYEGDYKNMGTWIKDFQSFAKEKKLILEKTYQWYTTCPKCAKKYGKNYVVFVGKIK
ncbi:MAG: hydrolase [Candidatus Woesearchaeota archaeon]|jgi:hypothetical protein